ncbi:MAG: T9SS type A sorting domain-containing protein [Candidatus Symbiothrix sp.]|jgi:hypothetical protein|nr:T9SS type A sorting domain-containing protein [Candidatus Symbiothrix sp.]
MKKGLLFIATMVVCISMVSAQTFKKLDNLERSARAVNKELLRGDVAPISQEKAPAAEFSIASKADFNGVSALQAPAALTAKYEKPVGTMYVGFDSDGGGYIPLIVGKSNTNWVFQNKSEGAASYEWKINGSSNNLTVAANGDMTFNPTAISMYYMPEITAKSGASSQSWYYGTGKDANQLLVASYDIWPLTNADHIHGGNYRGFSDGYGFGSEEIDAGENVTGVLTIYDKPQAPLLIQEIGSLIYSNSKQPLSTNGKLIATLYKIDAEGDLSDRVTSSEVYKDELITVADGVWYTPFHFTELDEETGLQTEISLLVDYAFAIRITWEDSNADLGFFMSENTYDKGSAYASTDKDHDYRFGRWNADRTVFYNMYDVAFFLKGTYPTFEVYAPTKQVTVPNAGGPATFTYEGSSYENIIIESTLGIEDVFAEYPDWLDISGNEVWDTDAGEDYYTNTIYIYLTGEPLPANLTGRAGNVVLNSSGVTTTIQVKQGDADWVGISSAKTTEVTKVARQGDDFVLSYPASATSVAVYNLTGQRVGEYQLNASGTYTLPAAGWAKGIYVLKFKGTNIAVKVIK